MAMCGQCQTSPPYFDQAYSLFSYQYPITQLVNKFKANQLSNHTQIQQWLLSLYLKQFHAQNIQAIITIPSSPFKTLKRGHQPAETLGNLLSQVTGIPLLTNVLRKRWLIKSQKSQSKAGREKQSKFVLNKAPLTYLPKPSRILLIDDVMTTAASLNEASQLLKAKGIQEIYALTVARTPLKH
jgi:ComF family protein